MTSELTVWDELRLLSAFQALQWDTGIFGQTHTQVRQIIADLTGLRLRRGATPPDATSGLEDYIAWAHENLSKTKGGAA